MPEDTIVYVFRDDRGRWLSSVDEEQAKLFVTAMACPQIEVMTLRELYERDPYALVQARSQYYWAEDLLYGGTARGALV